MPSPCVIEISDIALAVADRDGLRQASPCCAVAEGRELLLGEKAWARARLNPRLTHERFWAHLDQQPLPRPAGAARSHADLAWLHLRELWQACGKPDDEAILAVPPDWDHGQLALLLGIARACGIGVVGLVAAPVAAATAVEGEDDLLYLDAQAQRLRATRIGGGGERTLEASREASRRGLTALYDSWAAVIAEHFLHATRLDPLHRAQSEQMLYAQLPEWLAALGNRPAANFELRLGQRSYRVEVSRAALVAAVADDYRALIESARAGAQLRVLLSHRLAALPGLVEAFAEQGIGPLCCAPDAVARGVLQHFEAIRSDPDAPAFVTRLPGAAAAAAAADRPLPPAPSHALLGWRAYPLRDLPLLLDSRAPRYIDHAARTHGCSVRLHHGRALLHVPEGEQASVNGRPVAGESVLAAGDSLRRGGAETEWRFILAGQADAQE